MIRSDHMIGHHDCAAFHGDRKGRHYYTYGSTNGPIRGIVVATLAVAMPRLAVALSWLALLMPGSRLVAILHHTIAMRSEQKF